MSAARRSAGPHDDVRKRPVTVHREDPLIGDFPLQDGEATPESISVYDIQMDPGDILPGALASPAGRSERGHVRNTGHFDHFFYRELLQVSGTTVTS